jgi:hypothetical protein
MKHAASTMRWCGVGTILFVALARAMSTAGRVPWWDIDPMLSWTPETTRTPGESLALDALVWVAVAMVAAGELIVRRSIPWRTGLLVLIGCGGAALHAAVLAPFTAAGSAAPQHGEFANLIIASGWSAALAGGWALTIAARDRRVRAVAAAILLGAVLALAARGLYQVFVEHPRLVASFEANREERLAAIGLDPASQTAAIYERRLRQAEATGWFGFANVYGSIVGASLVAWGVIALGACRAARRGRISSGEAGMLVIIAVVAGTALGFSGSKGAIVATAMGCGLAAVIAMLKRIGGMDATPDQTSAAPHRLNPAARIAGRILKLLPLIVLLLAVVLPLTAVVVRGVVGERVSELSIYFRSQYAGAAARIIAEQPLTGVGPACFKDAYMLAKPPTSPEEVESPHSLLLDWQATLGLPALAWAVLFITWLVGAARGLRAMPTKHGVVGVDTPSHDGESIRADGSARAVMLLVPVTATAFAIWAEFQALGPDLILILALAAAIWWLAARTVVRVASVESRESGSLLELALLAAAAVLAAHSMIEVTPVFQGSAAVLFAMLALAARGPQMSVEPPAPRRAWALPAAIASAIAAVVAVAVAFQSANTLRAEAHLRTASVLARDSISARGESPPDVDLLRGARDELQLALPVYRFQLHEHVIAISWRIAISERDGARRDAAIQETLERAREVTIRYPRSSAAFGRLGAILEAAATAFQRPELFARAADAWERAAELDPYGLTPARRAALTHAASQRPETAASWARKALDIDASLRLDPIKMLTKAQAAELRALLR